MWNHRELPPEYYKNEVERLQRENAELRAQKITTILVPWSTFFKWFAGIVVAIVAIALSARIGGPRGAEVSVITSLFVLVTAIGWSFWPKFKRFN